jgi:putative addiction module component (TIGR02574 family)
MTRRRLREKLLGLPANQRAQLALDLISSLDGEAEPGVTRAWAIEVQRRAKEVKSGRTRLVEWNVVKRRIAKRLAANR